MSRACKGCGESSFRKGRRKAILHDDGSIEIALVCMKCARRAFSLLVATGAAAQRCTACKTAPATTCSECARKARAQLVAPVLATLRGLAKAFRANGTVGDLEVEMGANMRAEAYEHAAEALSREAEKG